MPKISTKGHHLPASPIRKLMPYAEAAKARGIHIFHLNIGQPDIATPVNMIEAIQNINREVIEYSHSAGYASLRAKMTEYYVRNSINIQSEDLLITTGGSEALLFCLLSCLDAGDELIIPEPFYANYNSLSQAGDIHVVPITSHIENNFALPPVTEFEHKITDKTKAILICNPGNPTGYLYSPEELEALREICLKHDLFLIADEVYREFVYDKQEHHSVLNLKGMDQHAIVVDSTSKRYSACGIRIGMLVSRNKEVIATALKLAQARLSPPTLGQIAAEAAVDTAPEYFERVHSEYNARRDYLIKRLAAMKGVRYGIPGGAFYVIAELPVEDAEHFCEWMLSEFSHDGNTVMMAPASGFYFNTEFGKKQVRIAYVLNKEDLGKAMDALEAGLKEYQKEFEG